MNAQVVVTNVEAVVRLIPRSRSLEEEIIEIYPWLHNHLQTVFQTNPAI